MPIKFYPDPLLRFAGVITDNPICSHNTVGLRSMHAMHAMHDSLQKVV